MLLWHQPRSVNAGGFVFTNKLWNPSGAWYEGYIYQSIVSMHTAAAIHVITTALGSDQGILTAIPGFCSVPNMRHSLIGPSNKSFDYADTVNAKPQHGDAGFFAANYCGKTEFAYRELEVTVFMSPRTAWAML